MVTLKSDGCALNKKEREAYNLIIPDNCWGFFLHKDRVKLFLPVVSWWGCFVEVNEERSTIIIKNEKCFIFNSYKTHVHTYTQKETERERMLILH